MNNNTMAREIDHNGPAWATESRDSGDGGPPWFVAPVGRGYLVQDVALEPTDIGQGDGAMTFEILNCPNESASTLGTYIEQHHGISGLNATFTDADAMRRYARILLEVADHADIILGGAR